jgi:hypothetical protein
MFKFLGSFIAKALLDNRLIDLPLSSAFLKIVTGKKLSFHDLKEIDADIGNSVEKMIQIVHQIHEIKGDAKLVTKKKSHFFLIFFRMRRQNWPTLKNYNLLEYQSKILDFISNSMGIPLGN